MISGLFVAAYGVIQYVFGLDMDKQVWVDEEMFTDIKMRAFRRSKTRTYSVNTSFGDSNQHCADVEQQKVLDKIHVLWDFGCIAAVYDFNYVARLLGPGFCWRRQSLLRLLTGGTGRLDCWRCSFCHRSCRQVYSTVSSVLVTSEIHRPLIV